MMTPTASTLGEAYYLAEWIIRLAMLAVVPFRRNPAATRSWLLLIFFLPVPGLLLFLAIGTPRFPQWRSERFAGLQPFLAGLRARLLPVAPPVGSSADRQIGDLACQLGHLPATRGNTIDYIDDYDGTIDRLIADIDAARHHVRLLVYIFADDAVGHKVIAALRRAVARGVACHVLVDPVGSQHWIRAVLRDLGLAGVSVRSTLPFRLWRRRTRRDMRNHRKIFLIDGIIGYAGSQNIIAKDFRRGVINRELVARITGPAVAEMAAVFLVDWYLETETMLEDAPVIPAPAGSAILQALPSGAEYPLEGFQTLLIWQIHQAQDRVTIVTPYLIPDEALLGAFRTAVTRGVTIDLIVSAVADQPLVNLAQSSYYDELLVSGVRIHRFRDFLLHAKNVCIDDRLAILGSSNVDIRSFQLNEEISLLIYDRAGIEGLRQIQLGYLADSDMLSLDRWRERGRLRKLTENAARLVSPLL
jgi:cardiolipin synthase